MKGILKNDGQVEYVPLPDPAIMERIEYYESGRVKMIVFRDRVLPKAETGLWSIWNNVSGWVIDPDGCYILCVTEQEAQAVADDLNADKGIPKDCIYAPRPMSLNEITVAKLLGRLR